ncbi:SixA phosphatase family protein [Geodermatophilus sp. URMC 64]
MEERRLLLVRHAQAAHGGADAERPLTDQGERTATAIGAWLLDAGLTPDRVLVSPARRAVQTWERAGGELKATVEPMVDERIYDNTVEALLAVLRETPEDVRTLALVGHNPSIGELAGILDDGRGDVGGGFPAGALAVFALAAPFAALGPGAATLHDFAVPRA